MNIYGDSLLIIKWMCREYQLHNVFLELMLAETSRISLAFDEVNFKHIYMENHFEADSLTKDGVNLNLGVFSIFNLELGE